MLELIKVTKAHPQITETSKILILRTFSLLEKKKLLLLLRQPREILNIWHNKKNKINKYLIEQFFSI